MGEQGGVVGKHLFPFQTGQRHMVHHFQYHGWPEQGVPVSGHGFIHFIQEVRNFYGSLNVTSPVVVHCR